jgi:ribosomal protein RSM22 (predicted rRNA methylase)
MLVAKKMRDNINLLTDDNVKISQELTREYSLSSIQAKRLHSAEAEIQRTMSMQLSQDPSVNAYVQTDITGTYLHIKSTFMYVYMKIFLV